MTEKSRLKPSILLDREAGQRYEHTIDVGKRIFAGSALVDGSKPIKARELNLVAQFHKEVSPTNPQSPWRLHREERSIENGQIVDPSIFASWESPGGPLEHIILAQKTAAIVVEELKGHLRPIEADTAAWAKDAIQQVRLIDANHAAATAAFHDEGREITHLLYTNELIGRRLLQRIGIREDIMAVLSGEQVMQLPLEQSMDDYLQKMPAEAVVIRIADEFGRRKNGTNRTMQADEITAEQWQQWAENYTKRPFSGRPSDKWIREHIPLHVANEERYFQGLDTWVQAVSSLTLTDLTRRINERLARTLPSLSESVPLSSKDLVDGQLVTRNLELSETQVHIEAITRIGGPNKKAGEDGFVVIRDGKTVQVILVDGGTQVAKVESLDNAGITGGEFIEIELQKNADSLSAEASVTQNLHALNRKIGDHIAQDHPDIEYSEDSNSVPYGSIAGVKLDFEKNILEVANAGDVFVVVEDAAHNQLLLTVDDVYEKDKQTFQAAQLAAKARGITVRKALEQRVPEVLSEMQKTIRMGNVGQIRRITGASNFDITSSGTVPISNIRRVLIFSDGAIPGDIDVHTPEGLKRFMQIVNDSGLEGLNAQVQQSAASDPDFVDNPRFRDIDDFTIVQMAF